MKANMGFTDRFIRTLVALTVAIMLINGNIDGVIGTILLLVALIFLGTSVINFCPIYRLFGWSTKGKSND